MRAFLTAAVLVLVPALVQAQTGTPTGYTLRIYPAGGTTAQLLSIQSSQVSCNQQALTTTTTAENPTTWVWDDIMNTGRVCIYADARFGALADGSYEGTAQAFNADGSSAETARVPFTRRRPNPPAALTGLKITR